ncbi:MAG: hypothetical protein EOO04_14110 [Chitinophagaceae bacterium]|nr:MAG: hypothetical protein EOO04_14110 [Chitinophagaceae bacterium]
MQIPEQVTGKQSDNASSREMPDFASAAKLYEEAKLRLLLVDEWKKFAGFTSAVFTLHDANGQNVTRKVTTGDFLRIDIPGPGTHAGKGYDWVRVIDIKETKEGHADALMMTVKPADDPTSDNSDTAHFFDEAATSTFIVKRISNIVEASVHGRNEKPNNNTSKVIDNIRNSMVASGAFGGFADIQWQSLTKGLLEQREEAR